MPEASGPEYWRWGFRALPWARIAWALVPGLALAALAWRAHRKPQHAPMAPWLLAAGFLWAELAIAGATESGFSLRRIERIVSSPVATSYWNAALELVQRQHEGWLEDWAIYMEGWPLHARNKPPGPVLFYVVMHVLAEERGTFLGALVVMSLAATVVPATYALARSLGGSPDAGLFAACCAAIAAGPTLICPELDQIYPLLTIGMVGAWAEALRRRSAIAAALTGALMFVATCFAFHLVALGLPLVVLALLHVRRERSVMATLVLASVALSVFSSAHAVLALGWGYDVLAVLGQALDDMRSMSAYHARVGPESRVFDVVDFALGLGWPSLIAAIALLVHPRAPLQLRDVALGGAVLVVTLAGLRLLPTETARTWMFVQPFFHVGAGAYLASVGRTERAWTLGLGLAILAITARNLVFVGP